MLKIKEFFKTAIKIAEAQQRVRFSFFTSTGKVEGYHVYSSDDVVFIKTGIRDQPCALVTDDNLIFINTQAEKSDPELLDALLAHEVGHIKLGHTAIVKKQNFFKKKFGGRNLEWEIAADAYAVKKTSKAAVHKLLLALPPSKEVKKRINALEC